MVPMVVSPSRIGSASRWTAVLVVAGLVVAGCTRLTGTSGGAPRIDCALRVGEYPVRHIGIARDGGLFAGTVDDVPLRIAVDGDRLLLSIGSDDLRAAADVIFDIPAGVSVGETIGDVEGFYVPALGRPASVHCEGAPAR